MTSEGKGIRGIQPKHVIYDELVTDLDVEGEREVPAETMDRLYKLLSEAIPKNKPYYVSSSPLSPAEIYEALARPKLESPVVAVHPDSPLLKLSELQRREELERQWELRRAAMLDEWTKKVVPPPSDAPFTIMHVDL